MLICIFSYLYIANATSQNKRANIWYFGDHAGLDFSTSPPTNLTNGKIDAIEGSSAISDTLGNLLFYTDGEVVWNRFHQKMPIAVGYYSSYTSTQAALIIPQPLNDSLYYVFTTDGWGSGNHGTSYAIINMNRDSGRGAVIKNQLLIKPTEEKLCATMHQNGVDVWITFHGTYDNSFYTYLLTKEGLSSCPVISKIGLTHDGPDAQGQIKFSCNGEFLAQTNWFSRKIELFRFNNVTGKVEYLVKTKDYFFPYGVEFSLSNKYVYISAKNKLFQYDLVLDTSIIIDSIFNNYQALQMGLDGKIYSSNFYEKFLPVINSPDSTDTLCRYKANGISISPSSSEYGLPNFISNYFNPKEPPFYYQQDFDSVYITNTSSNLNKWLFYRNGILIDSSLAKNPKFKLTNYGYYTIKQIINKKDTFERKVLKPYPILDNHDSTICSVDSVILRANNAYHCVYWNDTINSEELTVYKGGIYTVKGIDVNGVSVTDSIKVSFSVKPTPYIGKDNALCNGDSIMLSYQSKYKKLWNTGDTSSQILVKKSGIYTLTETNGKCKETDSATVTFLSYPNTILGNDTSICTGDILNLKGSLTIYNQSWNTGDTTYNILVNKQGLYILTETNIKCSSKDSIYVYINPPPNPKISKNLNTVSCNFKYKNYQWYRNGQPIQGANAKTYITTNAGNYFVLVTDSNRCEAFSDTIGLNTGISATSSFSFFSVYPNPAEDHFVIESSEEATFSIFDMKGSFIYQGKLTEAKTLINIQDWGNGIYYIELTNNRQHYIQKITITNNKPN